MVLVTSSAEVEVVIKESGKYDGISGGKINREKSVDLQLGS